MARRYNRGYNRYGQKAVYDTPINPDDLAAIEAGYSVLGTDARNFAEKTVTTARQHDNKLTVKWADRISSLLEQVDRAQNPPAVVTKAVGNLHGVLKLFQNNPLKDPTLRMAVPKVAALKDSADRENYYSFQLKLGKPGSKYEGDLSVLDYSRQPSWMGRVMTNGVFEATRSYRVSQEDKEIVGETLEQISKNPVESATLYGHIMGKCCFCGQGVGHGDDERSAALGYGPVCAKNWGLPWSTKAANAAKKQVRELIARQASPVKRKVNTRRKKTATRRASA